VRRDHPVLADDALQRVELAFLVVARRVRRDVDVAAMVVEDRPLVGLLEVCPRRLVEAERLGDLGGADLGPLLEVDPEQLRSAQPARALGKRLEMVDLIAVEQDGVADDLPLGRVGGVLPRTRAANPRS
jgi:hypothetical protein